VLNEKVYVRAPPGLPVPEGHVLLLLKAIYGMPQAGREFCKLLRSVILAMGFKQSEFAHCFFFLRIKDGFVIIMTYVDDITITTDNEKLRKEVLSEINAKLKLEDCGVIKSFLGMSFGYNAKKLYWHITQGTYIKDLCKTMDLTQGESKAAFTPEIKQIWSEEASTAKSEAELLRVSNYSPRSKVGSILWCIVCCRPDLMHTIAQDATNLDAVYAWGRYYGRMKMMPQFGAESPCV
jgi:hypothetical protein